MVGFLLRKKIQVSHADALHVALALVILLKRQRKMYDFCKWLSKIIKLTQLSGGNIEADIIKSITASYLNNRLLLEVIT
jgi:hypothetical protein